MKYAYERNLGSKTIMGTEHPITVVVYRGKHSREWVLAVLCNGTGMIPRSFKTRRKAIAAASGQEWRS